MEKKPKNVVFEGGFWKNSYPITIPIYGFCLPRCWLILHAKYGYTYTSPMDGISVGHDVFKGIYLVSIDMVPTWEYKLDGLNLWGGFLSA